MKKITLLILLSLALPVTLSADTVRIMSYNIRYGTGDRNSPNDWLLRREAAVNLMKAGNYDFIGLQEAQMTAVEGYDQVKYVRENLPGYGMFVRSREISAETGEATPILYRRDRWEMDADEHGLIWHSETPDVPGSKSWDTACPRVATWGRFRELEKNAAGEAVRTGRSVYFLNTHLDHVSGLARDNAAAQIADFVANRKDQNAPVFITGDFNAGEHSTVTRYLLGGEVTVAGEKRVTPAKLTDTFRVLHPEAKEVGTFNSFRKRGDGKIDYIFALPGTEVLTAEILTDTYGDGKFPSDHFPVTAECELR